MKKKFQRKTALVLTLTAFAVFGFLKLTDSRRFVAAQTTVSPTPTPTVTAEFNQADAISKLKAQIKGKEKEPAEKVFKNIQSMKGVPAAQLLAISVPRPARLENLWGYLTNVYTKPAFRGKGIGAELLRQVKIWSIAQDFELLIVSPSDDSIKFYKREDFAEQTDFYQHRLRDF